MKEETDSKRTGGNASRLEKMQAGERSRTTGNENCGGGVLRKGKKELGENRNINKAGPSSELSKVIRAFLGRNEDLVPTALNI